MGLLGSLRLGALPVTTPLTNRRRKLWLGDTTRRALKQPLRSRMCLVDTVPGRSSKRQVPLNDPHHRHLTNLFNPLLLLSQTLRLERTTNLNQPRL